MNDTGLQKRLWERRWMVAVFAGTLLAALVLVLALKAGPAEAACPITGCGGGGTHPEIVDATLTVTSNPPSNGSVTSNDGQINCGLGATTCSHTYSYRVTCSNDTGECTAPPYTTVSLTPSQASGYNFLGWSGACSGTGSCFVTMDTDKSVGATFGDVTPPTVSLTSPADNATVVSRFTASASASDGAGVAKVDFLVDGIVKATANSSPYTVSIDTTGLSDGPHTLSARAQDLNGLQSTTSSRTVTVDHTSPTVTKRTPKGTRVSPKANVVATFSEAMNPATLVTSPTDPSNPNVGTSTTFTLRKGTTQIGAVVSYIATTTSTGTIYRAVLNPNTKLKAGVTYTARINSAAKDLTGNPLVAKTWKFTIKR